MTFGTTKKTGPYHSRTGGEDKLDRNGRTACAPEAPAPEQTASWQRLSRRARHRLCGTLDADVDGLDMGSHLYKNVDMRILMPSKVSKAGRTSR